MNSPVEGTRIRQSPSEAGLADGDVATAPRTGRALADLRFANAFASLGDGFGTPVAPVPLPEPYLVAASAEASKLIGVAPQTLADDDSVALLTGNRVAPGSRPFAAVYAGHQFGVWAGRLGDGRALLLGDVASTREGRWELQLKGSGHTPYSRMGDGRAVLRSSIREFLCSEAMAALGIPTTRALSVTGSDSAVIRETVETAAVVVRMAPSFVRFGSFEYFYHFREPERLRRLADFVIERHYPDCAARPDGERYAAFLEQVSLRTARLIAAWQAVGFCHGVMNTDNMSILGLTIDYGPFGFLDGFDAGHICNHSDGAGRYAYDQQPEIGEWNCYALGRTLVGLIGSVDATKAALSGYRAAFHDEHQRLLRAKLGLNTADPDDSELIQRLFSLMDRNRVDFTQFFRRLGGVSKVDAAGDAPVRDLFLDRDACDAWLAEYRHRLAREPATDSARRKAMDATNPKFVLRNHLAELAIRDAASANGREAGFTEVRRLAAVLERPFDEQPENESDAAPAPDWAKGLEVSCSS